MMRIDSRQAAPRDFAPGTKASANMLQHATARLNFRRARDVLPGKIETPRLILRAPIRGDVPALVALADNQAIAERLSRLPSPYTRADAIAFVEIYAQRPDERPYAITTEKGELLGIVGFSYAMGQHPELGYWLGEPHWGKGYMTEAARALIDTAQRTHYYDKIVAKALASNEPSLNVLIKLGFARVSKKPRKSEPADKQIISLELQRPRWM